MLSLDHMNATLAVDSTAKTIRVQAGKRLHELYADMERHGLAFEAVGNIMIQSVAGALSTATHGSNAGAGSLSEHVVALRMVLANGTRVSVDRSHGDLLSVVSTSIGALGVITEVTLQCVETYKVDGTDPTVNCTKSTVIGLQDYLENFSALIDGPQSHIFQMDLSERAVLMVSELNRCTSGPKCVPWYQGLTTYIDFPFKTYEAEMWVDRQSFPSVMRQFSEFVEEHEDKLPQPEGKEHVGPIAVWRLAGRPVAKESSWMSPGFGHSTMALTFVQYCINVTAPGSHEDMPCDSAALAAQYALFGEALERISYLHGARPHWGKANLRSNASYLAQVYPFFNRFNQLRLEWDPEALFMNDYLRHRLDGVRSAVV